jgi:hypothetical protein
MQQIVEHSPDAHRGSPQPDLARSAVALSIWRERLLLQDAADAARPRVGAAVAGLRQRGEPAARELGGAAARTCNSFGRRRHQRTFGAPVSSRKVHVGLAGGAVAIAITLWTSRSPTDFIPPSALPLTCHVSTRCSSRDRTERSAEHRPSCSHGASAEGAPRVSPRCCRHNRKSTRAERSE